MGGELITPPVNRVEFVTTPLTSFVRSIHLFRYFSNSTNQFPVPKMQIFHKLERSRFQKKNCEL